MGNRITVTVTSQQDNPVTLYSHWAGEEVLAVVESVLKKTTRKGDSTYLFAQIVGACFSAFDYDGELGFGIWAGEGEYQDNPPIFVNADTLEVSRGN